MNQVIDACENYTGWTVSDGALVTLTENEFTSSVYLGSKSLQVNFETNSSEEYIEKNFGTISTTNFTDLSLNYMQAYGPIPNKLSTYSDFTLTLSIGTGTGESFAATRTWYLPVTGGRNFSTEYLGLEGITSFETIRITYKKDVKQMFFFDNIILCSDEVIVDTLVKLKGILEGIVTYSLGALSSAASAGDSTISISDYSFLDRHTLLKISEGSTVEYHQLDSKPVPGTPITFSGEWDGQTIINNFTTAATVELYVPCQISSKDIKFVAPGIIISGFVANNTTPNVGYSFNSYRSDNLVRVQRNYYETEIDILFQVLCSSPELMAKINQTIYDFFVDEKLVEVNNKLFDLVYNSSDLEEGDLEEEVDTTNHSLILYAQLRHGEAKRYVKYPFETVPNFNFVVDSQPPAVI